MLPDLAAHVEAVHAGKPDVEEDKAHLVAVELDERILTRADPDDVIAVLAEVAAHQLPDRRLVLDQQDRSRSPHPRSFTAGATVQRRALPARRRCASFRPSSSARAP